MQLGTGWCGREAHVHSHQGLTRGYINRLSGPRISTAATWHHHLHLQGVQLGPRGLLQPEAGNLLRALGGRVCVAGVPFPPLLCAPRLPLSPRQEAILLAALLEPAHAASNMLKGVHRGVPCAGLQSIFKEHTALHLVPMLCGWLHLPWCRQDTTVCQSRSGSACASR